MIKSTFIVILMIFMLSASYAVEQDKPRSILFEISPGVTYNLTKQLNLPDFQYQNYFAGITTSVEFSSEYNIKIGIESGYLPITGIDNQQITNHNGQSQANAQLSTIPILLRFSMSYSDFSISYANGAYFMISYVDAFGQTSRSKEVASGLKLGLQYNILNINSSKILLHSNFYYMSDIGHLVVFFGIASNFNILNL